MTPYDDLTLTCKELANIAECLSRGEFGQYAKDIGRAYLKLLEDAEFREKAVRHHGEEYAGEGRWHEEATMKETA